MEIMPCVLKLMYALSLLSDQNQIQQNTGDGLDNNAFRLVEVSPFDITIQNDGLHVSYPTAFLGTSPSDNQKRYVAINLASIFPSIVKGGRSFTTIIIFFL